MLSVGRARSSIAGCSIPHPMPSSLVSGAHPEAGFPPDNPANGQQNLHNGRRTCLPFVRLKNEFERVGLIPCRVVCRLASVTYPGHRADEPESLWRIDGMEHNLELDYRKGGV